jgi:hypothetical protein
VIKLKVVDGVVQERQVQARGQSFTSREQYAWLDLPSGERRKVRVRVDRGQQPYAPGEYTVADESFVVGEYGDLQLGFALKLERIQQPAKLAGAQ